MGRNRSRDTTPELAVRCYLHAAGFRYRLHQKALPGSPDIVLPRYRVAIFVHGCFWHQHENCPRAGLRPRTNEFYWKPKFAETVARDRKNQEKLSSDGWRVRVVWECELQQEKLRKLVEWIKTESVVDLEEKRNAANSD